MDKTGVKLLISSTRNLKFGVKLITSVTSKKFGKFEFD